MALVVTSMLALRRRESTSLWSEFLTRIADEHLGDLASIAGFAISIIGFGLAIYNVRRSRRAAERAQEAAQSARNSIRIFETLVDISAVIGMLEEMKRAHRNSQWAILPDRYAALRKILIGVRKSRNLSDRHSAALQGAIVNLSDIEKAVEKALPNVPANSHAKFNAALSENIDALAAVLAELKFGDTGA